MVHSLAYYTRMHPPLPSYPAKLHALYLQHLLATRKAIDFDAGCHYSTDRLFMNGGGIMFGVMVARDRSGNEVLLKAFSGSLGGVRNLPGWAAHLVDDCEYDAYMQQYDHRIKALEGTAEQAALSHKALSHYYGLYNLAAIDGGRIPLAACFQGSNIPTGSGDCCAIKLLHTAFTRDLQPISMAEFFFGRSRNRRHLEFCDPCDEKCKPIIGHMLGLDIIHRDEHILVVNKPSSLLSVPGRTVQNIDSVETRVRRLYPDAPLQCATHRLDMDTSGLLVVALSKQGHAGMQQLFRQQQVTKQYTALLDGILTRQEGTITLPFRLDPDNRPHQVYDEVNGKWGTTTFKRLGVERTTEGRLVTRILFEPRTGRTHQLRLHSAHPKGLGLPILGDRLYGNGMKDRLHLHAHMISFTHPITGESMTFSAETPF